MHLDHQSALEMQLLHNTTESGDHGQVKSTVHFNSVGEDKSINESPMNSGPPFVKQGDQKYCVIIITSP